MDLAILAEAVFGVYEMWVLLILDIRTAFCAFYNPNLNEFRFCYRSGHLFIER